MTETTAALLAAFVVDYVVVGGGNAKLVKNTLPAGARLGHNLTAFRGGLRLWSLGDVPTLAVPGEAPPNPAALGEWRVI